MGRLRNLSAAVAVLAGLAGTTAARADVQLLNASYDPTRELYQAINKAFAAKWQKDSGERVSVRMSHGGSGTQARAVIDGLDADVVTLAIAADIDAIASRTGKIPADWQKRLPDNSSPYTSTIVFVVRQGNPQGIKDWDDLIKPGIKVITPNPKTSGNGKLSLLAAYGYVLQKGGSEDDAKGFVQKLYANVPILDTGARGASTTFNQKHIGDVH